MFEGGLTMKQKVLRVSVALVVVVLGLGIAAVGVFGAWISTLWLLEVLR